VKVGVLTVLYHDRPLEEALDRIAALGVRTVELATGNYVGNAHADPAALLADTGALERLRGALASREMEISALSQHGNPLHPDPEVGRAHHETWRRTLELAQRLEVATVIGFSGCPGDHSDARRPNWVTCPWPPDFTEALAWQWEERVIPYWTREAEHARAAGVTVGFEMHPGMVVYNPETFMRLRAAVGEVAGCNFDPSHLFWQGIDVVEAVKEIARAGALVHVHAKDTALDAANVARNGVLDTKPYDRVLDRSWSFRTVGYGHGEDLWRRLLSTLSALGYDGAISIEHEDGLMSMDEGLAKAVRLLDRELLGASSRAGGTASRPGHG
jgi:sugar phosphate isomerase/epimerase